VIFYLLKNYFFRKHGNSSRAKAIHRFLKTKSETVEISKRQNIKYCITLLTSPNGPLRENKNKEQIIKLENWYKGLSLSNFPRIYMLNVFYTCFTILLQ
jgi:hypothetical protein